LSFEINILSELLLSMPFFIGYTRPSYKDSTAKRQAVLRGHLYQEQLKEQREWEKYQEQARAEEEKGLFASFAGALVGSVVGFFTGGPGGAKIGWNAGKGIGTIMRKNDPEYFDAPEWLSENKTLKGGKFNRGLDRANWRKAINESEDMEDMAQLGTLMNFGKAAFVGFTTDWSKFDKNAWKELTFSEKWNELMESFKSEKIEDFKKARENARAQRMENRVKKLREMASAETLDTLDDATRLADIAAVDESLGWPDITGGGTSPQDLSSIEIEKKVDAEVKKITEAVREDPSIVIPQLNDYNYDPNTGTATKINVPEQKITNLTAKGNKLEPFKDYKPFDKEWRKKKGKYEYKKMWEKIKGAGKQMGSISKATGQKIGSISKDAINKIRSWKPFEETQPIRSAIGALKEAKPFENLVDNLRDLDWRPFDYDWRVEKNKTLFRDFSPFEDYSPFSQSWRRENDKFIFEDWWKNRKVKPFQKLGAKISNWTPGEGMKARFKKYNRPGYINSYPASGTQTPEVDQKLIESLAGIQGEVEEATTQPGTGYNPEVYADRNIELTEDALSALDNLQDGNNVFEGNIEPISSASELGESFDISENVNAARGKIAQIEKYIDEYGIDSENARRYGIPEQFQDLFIQVGEGENYESLWEFVIKHIEKGTLSDLLEGGM